MKRLASATMLSATLAGPAVLSALVAGCARGATRHSAIATGIVTTTTTTTAATGGAHAPPEPQILVAMQDAPHGRPDAVVDLATSEGLARVNGAWRTHDVRVQTVDARGPGADLRPTGKAVTAYDVAPRPGLPVFDDGWQSIAPADLDARRGNGRVSFVWYRVAMTLPERIGDVDVRGATIGFEIVVDDYAEVWVDGALVRDLGRAGGTVVKGFNAPNRVALTRDARPGQRFDVAVFGMNGPISASPENFVWIKTATLDVHRAPAGMAAGATAPRSYGHVRKVRAELDAVVSPTARVEKVATGFLFTEGPVWAREGSLLFSDPNANTIWRYRPEGALEVFRPKSGYKGVDIGTYHQPGSNGLTIDREGRLTINEHGNRRVTRLEKNGQLTVLADRYEGKRLNSPNDLVYKSDGALYFTDPPFGLPKVFEDPKKELPFSGVYRVKDGVVTLLDKSLEGPNGIVFSPDEKYLYVDDWDTKKKVVLRFPVKEDGTLGPGETFFDMTGAPEKEVALDGMKIDRNGNLFVSGPGGVWILSPEGKELGMIEVDELPANFAWGDDGKTLYMTARTSIYRVRVEAGGVLP